MDNNNFKGYSLFKDVEDRDTRQRNQAVVMANIFEEHAQDGKVSARGLQLILEYFKEIVPVERSVVKGLFKSVLQQRGHNYAS